MARRSRPSSGKHSMARHSAASCSCSKPWFHDLRSVAMISSDPKTVVVTGASAGIGRATALAFARRGWRVAIVARGQEGLDSARREIEAVHGEALALRADMAEPDGVFAAAEEVVKKWGAIDVWVNNAMV